MGVQISGAVARYPARASLAWYMVLILVGTLILQLPLCRGSRQQPVSWLDAAFTSTSAACVTGLTVRSTEHDFSFYGQLVILVLIQLGGIGIMTVTTYVMFHLGSTDSIQHRLVLQETLGAAPTQDLRNILRNVLLMSLTCEAVGFLLLLARTAPGHPWTQAAWLALFHSVSAFCNAGFSLHDDSLTRYQADPLVNFTICGLVVIGGIGFPVVMDISRRWRQNGLRCWEALHLHSKLTLVATGMLLVGGTVAFTALEWHGVLADKPWWQRLMMGMFQSVTCRTAGFNTVAIGELTNASLFVCILLMAVGAGSCSTGGGFKVTTMMVMVLKASASFQGRRHVNIFRRRVAEESINKAQVLLLVFAAIMTVALLMLLIAEQSRQPHPESQGLFLDALFEVVSALGTVGLSVGMTPHLTVPGQMIVIVLMIIGRLGPLTIFAALSSAETKPELQLACEEPMIG